MALTVGTITTNGDKALQPNFVSTFTVACDDAYPATEGGYDLDAVLDVKGKLYGHEIVAVIAHPFYDGGATTGYFGVWVPSTNMLKIYLQDTGAEVANDTDLTGITAMALTVFSQ